MCIAAWAYLMAALCMGTTAAVTVERTGWEIPSELVGPLVYWVFVCSVIGYYVVTWATQHLPASQVCCFSNFSQKLPVYEEQCVLNGMSRLSVWNTILSPMSFLLRPDSHIVVSC